MKGGQVYPGIPGGVARVNREIGGVAKVRGSQGKSGGGQPGVAVPPEGPHDWPAAGGNF